MASFHLSVHPNVSRGKGQSLVRTAAYNGRYQLTDERTGEVWNYSHLGAALASGIYAPKDAPDWARDLGQLVNAVEQFEKRSDSQLAMNLDIAVPHEQTLEQNRRLLQDFVREEFQRKGYAAHFAIHPPDRDGDHRNIHAHVLVTLRKIDANGFARTKTEQQDRYRNRGEFVEQLREKWERLANRHLERNGYDARIDRRSLQDQGVLDREPQQHRGPTVTTMERENRPTRIVAEIGKRHRRYAALRALEAEERQIDAQIIDLEAKRAEREARAAARGQVDDIRPDREAPANQNAPEKSSSRTPDSSPSPGRARARPENPTSKVSRGPNHYAELRPTPEPTAAASPKSVREAVQAREPTAAPSAPGPWRTPTTGARSAAAASNDTARSNETLRFDT